MSIDDQLKKLSLAKGEGVLLDAEPMTTRVTIAEFRLTISRHLDGTFFAFVDLEAINRALLPATLINITGSGSTAATALIEAATQLADHGGPNMAFGGGLTTGKSAFPKTMAMAPEGILPAREVDPQTDAALYGAKEVEEQIIARGDMETDGTSGAAVLVDNDLVVPPPEPTDTISEVLSRIDLAIADMEANQK